MDPADAEALRREAERIGLPVMIKAAGGGGGIGMQIVRELSELEKAAKTCADRGRAAFGDERIYLERYLSTPHHIEVQLLRDRRGNAVALGERECSVQRRHQKVVEETPSPASFFQGEGVRRGVSDCSSARSELFHSADYVGAGTVEFVADGQDELYFLEVNARLQVEHPVTEAVTGLDLVEQQLRIAAGEALSPDVLGPSAADTPSRRGSTRKIPTRAICRSPASIERLRFPEGHGRCARRRRLRRGQRGHAALRPLDRQNHRARRHARRGHPAARRGARCDRGADRMTQGPRVTNLDFLRRFIASAEFSAGNYDTGILERM